jgi:uncharacterized membrane protein
MHSAKAPSVGQPTRDQHVQRPVQLPADGSGRSATFSDGIFAITITLLVLEIERPSFSEPSLATRLLENWSQYAAFVVSFVYIGALWLNHHALFAEIRRVDLKLNCINLLILGTTSLLPFSTAVVAGASGHNTLSSNQATAVVLYALVALLMSAAWLPVFPYLGRHPELLVNPMTVGCWPHSDRVRWWVSLATWSPGPWLVRQSVLRSPSSSG